MGIGFVPWKTHSIPSSHGTHDTGGKRQSRSLKVNYFLILGTFAILLTRRLCHESCFDFSSLGGPEQEVCTSESKCPSKKRQELISITGYSPEARDVVLCSLQCTVTRGPLVFERVFYICNVVFVVSLTLYCALTSTRGLKEFPGVFLSCNDYSYFELQRW